MDPLDPSSSLRAVRLAMTLVTTSLLMAMASCDAPGELGARGATGEVGARGAAAVWTAAPNQSLEPGTSEFTVLVSRLGCNNGVTGEVLEPDVRLDAQRVVLTFAVEPDEPSAANCLGMIRCDSTSPLRGATGGTGAGRWSVLVWRRGCRNGRMPSPRREVKWRLGSAAVTARQSPRERGLRNRRQVLCP